MSRGILLAAVAVVALCGIGSWILSSSVSQRVRRVTGNDPKLQNAIRQARREMPEFLRQLASPRPGQRFAIRGRFSTPAGPEYLWVRDPVLVDGIFRGTLDQEPMAARTLRRGESVRVPDADVVDWLIRDPGGRMRGGYTEQALRP
ncbi:MAG: DUF2314 domain-containing protein [Fimbriimonas sp.]